MKTPEERMGDASADELIEWFLRWRGNLPDGVMSGMLVSAAAELLIGRPEVGRAEFLQIAGNAWDRWSERKGCSDPPVGTA